tara:strand:+ start:4599 stop:5195 length:597 start_codon:yes stop_codon:yes gene_type:complete
MNYIFYKNCFDIIFAIFLIIILIPLLIILPLMNVLLNGFPIFYIQQRSGKNTKLINLIKLRTIKKDNNDITKIHYTFFGLFLRRSGLDEIFQLINILKGDLSFVGPRPLYPKYNELYDSRQKKRLNVKPGLTGLAQINQHNDITWKEKIDFDIEYINKMNFILDIKIICKTISLLFLRIFDKKFISISEEFKGNNKDE